MICASYLNPFVPLFKASSADTPYPHYLRYLSSAPHCCWFASVGIPHPVSLLCNAMSCDLLQFCFGSSSHPATVFSILFGPAYIFCLHSIPFGLLHRSHCSGFGLIPFDAASISYHHSILCVAPFSSLLWFSLAMSPRRVTVTLLLLDPAFSFRRHVVPRGLLYRAHYSVFILDCLLPLHRAAISPLSLDPTSTPSATLYRVVSAIVLTSPVSFSFASHSDTSVRIVRSRSALSKPPTEIQSAAVLALSCRRLPSLCHRRWILLVWSSYALDSPEPTPAHILHILANKHLPTTNSRSLSFWNPLTPRCLRLTLSTLTSHVLQHHVIPLWLVTAHIRRYGK